MSLSGAIPVQTMTFPQYAGVRLAKSVPRGPLFTAGKTRSRARGLVTYAKFRRPGKKEPEAKEPEDTRTKILGGLFGGNKSGTQRLKSGKPTEESQSPKASPSKAQRPKASPPKPPSPKPSPSQAKKAPANFLQTARIGRKEQNTVFVAGSTGRLGLRIVRELLLAGYKVRAGARNTQKAQSYVNAAAGLGLLPQDATKRLQIVPVDLEDPSSISAAIGNATRVVQAIGADETKVLDFGAPKRIDGKAAIDLVNASVEAGITQYVMVTSLGTGKFGWPASALNLFGGILIQKRQAEKALEASGLNYTIVRPGGMERPADNYKETNNVRLSPADNLFGGQVSRLQVAELIASALSSPDLAKNKILEVVAETTAPKLDYNTLLRDFEASSYVPEPQIVEEEEAEEPVVKAPPKPARRVPKRRPAPKAQEQSLSGNQDAIAEAVAKKEIDIKLRKDTPEPSQQSKNVAEDIAKAEIRIDSGKESPTRNWFGLGGKKAKGAAKPTGKDAQPASPVVSSSIDQEAELRAIERAKRPPQSPEDVQSLNAARSKTAETRAKQEADFLARLEAQRQDEAQKKKSATSKREQEALEKSRKDRDALFAKREKEEQAYREQQAKAKAERQAAAEKSKADAEAAAEKSKADAEAAAKSTAEVSQSVASEAADVAKKGAKEARDWIDDWRNGESSGKKPQPSTNGSSPSAAKSPASESANGASKSNAEDARAWIEDWRSRTGAKK